VSDDLEKFLQRAAQRRRQRSEPSIVIIDEQNADVVEPEIVEPEIVRPSLASESVGDHVHRHIDTDPFTDRADEMGDHIEDAHQEMDDHIHEIFDHKLSNLRTQKVDDPNAISDDVPKRTIEAHWLAEMLQNPETLRQAIVLNEIMTPAFRRQQ
jgi:hypothetical protein